MRRPPVATLNAPTGLSEGVPNCGLGIGQPGGRQATSHESPFEQPAANGDGATFAEPFLPTSLPPLAPIPVSIPGPRING